MMKAQWSYEADRAENSKKRDWTPYIGVCRYLTSKMVAHLATYPQVEEGGKVAEGQSREDKSGRANSENVDNVQAKHNGISSTPATSSASKEAKKSGRCCKMS